MTVFVQTFEGGTSGTAITAANSGGGGNTAFNFVTLGTGATFTFDGTRSAHGALSGKIDPNATTPTTVIVDLKTGITPTKNLAYRGYYYFTAATTADMHIIRFSPDGGTTRTASVHLNAAGKLRLSDATGTTGIWTAANAIPLNQWVRIEVYAAVGTTTANGTVSIGTYLADSTTPIDAVFTSTSANLGTADLNDVQTGKITGPSNGAVYWIDDLAVSDAASGLIGPVATSVATVRPTSVIDNSGVYTNQGGAASLQAAVADESDTTYVESPTAPASKAITFGGFPTLSTGNVKVTVRTRAQPTSGPTTTQTIELLQGATVIASTGAVTVTDAWADYVLTLSGAENAAITDRSALRVRITANQP